MKEPTYRDAMKASWKLAWHHKTLWIFGLFAAFLGQMGVVELFIKTGVTASSLEVPSLFLYFINLFGGDIAPITMSVESWVLLVWLSTILLGFLVMGIYLAINSQAAIVHSTARFIESKEKKFEDSSVSWHESHKHFWTLLLLNVLRKLILIVAAVFVGWAAVNAIAAPDLGDLMLFVVLFILAAGMGMILSFWLIYAIGYIVVEQFSFWKAVRAAWRLFTDHWLVSIEVGCILIVLNLFVSLLALLGLYLFFIPGVGLWILSFFVQSSSLYFSGVIAGLILFLTYIMFLGSVFTVFTTATWTYLFTKMHKKGIKSRLLRLGKFH